MAHIYRMTDAQVEEAVLSGSVPLCPNCQHGMDPHGVDPGGICGVDDENRQLCQCRLTPSAIHRLITLAMIEAVGRL